MGRGALTAGGSPLRHSANKGVFLVFMTMGILFQCYSVSSYSRFAPSGRFIPSIVCDSCEIFPHIKMSQNELSVIFPELLGNG